jgi:hypothetical protein
VNLWDRVPVAYPIPRVRGARGASRASSGGWPYGYLLMVGYLVVWMVMRLVWATVGLVGLSVLVSTVMRNPLVVTVFPSEVLRALLTVFARLVARSRSRFVAVFVVCALMTILDPAVRVL